MSKKSKRKELKEEKGKNKHKKGHEKYSSSAYVDFEAIDREMSRRSGFPEEYHYPFS